MLTSTSFVSPTTRREYLVIPHLHFSQGGYERCTYDIYLETKKVAECALTSEIPFTVTRFETSN